MHISKVRALSGMLTSPGLLSSEQLEQRSYYLPKAFGAAEPQQQQPGSKQQAAAAVPGDQHAESNSISNDDEDDEVTDERLSEVVRAVSEKFGSGCPPGEADPSFITCFVGLPGE